MKRKVQLLTIAFSIFALLFAACSLSSSGDNTAGDASNDDSAAGNGEPISIEYYHVNSNDWGGHAVKEIVKNFNESQDEIVVTETFIPDIYQGVMQKTQAAISGGNPPDVAQVGYNFLEYVHGNLPYTPIEEVAAMDESEPNFIQDNFLENIVDLSRTGDGSLVGLSYGLSNPVLYYNADMLEEVGWDPDTPPATWEEVRELSEQIKEQTGEYGIYIQEPPDNWAQYAMAKSNGGEWLEEKDGELVAAVDSPEVIEAYQFAGDMVLDGIALHANQDEGQQAFGNGKVAMYYTTIGKSAGIAEQSNFDLRTTMSPTFGDKPRGIPAGGNALVVFSQDDEKKKAAWEFIKYLQSPEALALWIEGTGYLPPREGADDLVDSNPLMQPAVAQKDSVVQWANFPGDNGLQAEQALLDARDQILTGTKTAEEAMKEAAEKINGFLK